MEAIRYGMKISSDYNDDVQPVTINHTHIHASLNTYLGDLIEPTYSIH